MLNIFIHFISFYKLHLHKLTKQGSNDPAALVPVSLSPCFQLIKTVLTVHRSHRLQHVALISLALIYVAKLPTHWSYFTKI